MEIENFKERYLALKAKGKTDESIALMWYIGQASLSRLKMKHGLKGFTHQKKLSLTEEQLKQVESIGLSKMVIHHRVFYHKWDLEKAITIPKLTRSERRGFKK